VSRFRAGATRTFSSLRIRNYRLYFLGQIVSLSGTWMQSVGQVWLVLKLTGSGVDLGLVVALQFLPVLLGGSWGGVIADRVDKRKLLIVTQTVSGLFALALGVLTVTNVVTLWMVYGLALGLGCVTLVDMPARQSFVMEMVGRKDLANAVSLNSVVVNAARVVGPALAGLLTRHRRHRDLLPPERRLLRRCGGGAGPDAGCRARPRGSDPKEEGPAAGGVPVRVVQARPAGPAAADGRGRDHCLQLLGHLPVDRAPGLPRRGGRVRCAVRGHGDRRRGRWAGRGRQALGRPASCWPPPPSGSAWRCSRPPTCRACRWRSR